MNRFEPAERGSSWFVLDSLELAGKARPSFGLTPDYQYRPLAIYGTDGNVRSFLVEHALTAHVGANVVLWNRNTHTFDYRFRRVSLNRKQTRLEADGSFKIVHAASDPGVPNWLETEGRASGSVFWRFLLPEEEIAPLDARVVKLADAKTA